MKPFEVIDARAIEKAKQFRVSEAELLAVIGEVFELKVYLEFGYSNLFGYVKDRLGIPENQVYNFTGVATKCLEIPLLKEAIQTGKLNVSVTRRFTAVVNQENAAEWIEKATTLKQRDLEREVKKHRPEPEKKAKIRCKNFYLRLHDAAGQRFSV